MEQPESLDKMKGVVNIRIIFGAKRIIPKPAKNIKH